MANGKETTAITQAAKHLPLTIESGDDAWRHAQRLAASSLVPEALRGKPNDLMLILMWGRRLGLSPEQAVQDIHCIKSKPVIAADALVAQCVQHRDICAYFVPTVSTSERAEYQTHRVGSPVPTTMAYTIEDAKRAGLTNKDVWKQHTAAMLRARCSAAMARAVYPDLVRGFYLADELEEAPGTTTVVQAPKTLADLTAKLSKPAVIKVEPDIYGDPAAFGKQVADAVEAAAKTQQVRENLPVIDAQEAAEIQEAERAPTGEP